MNRVFHALNVLLMKDMRSVLRDKPRLLSVFGFSLLLVIVASFAFRQPGMGIPEQQNITAGATWLIFAFIGVLILGQSFEGEADNRALWGAMLSTSRVSGRGSISAENRQGVGPGLILLSKSLVNVSYLGLVEILVITLHGLFFGYDISPYLPGLVLLVFLGAIGYGVLGTVLALISSSIGEGKEILLPLMLYPLVLPLLAAEVFLTGELIAGRNDFYLDSWFVVLLCFDGVVCVFSWVVSDYLFE